MGSDMPLYHDCLITSITAITIIVTSAYYDLFVSEANLSHRMATQLFPKPSLSA